MIAGPVELESALWRFSLAVYRGAGVQEECLDVQERHGIDVNLLMLCAYVGAVEGAALSDGDVADALATTGAWHAEVVRALRQVRRTLKPWGLAGQGGFSNVAEALRVKVKGAELEAECIEQAMMWAWLRSRAAQLPPRDPRAALAGNVRALLVRCGAEGTHADPLRALPRFCAAALQVGAGDRSTGTGS
jgi:uncharacterized protein (TIGR02444 family)